MKDQQFIFDFLRKLVDTIEMGDEYDPRVIELDNRMKGFNVCVNHNIVFAKAISDLLTAANIYFKIPPWDKSSKEREEENKG